MCLLVASLFMVEEGGSKLLQNVSKFITRVHGVTDEKPTITETISLNRLYWIGHVQRVEGNGILKSIVYEFGNKKAER
jgi:hypothetical protein